MSRKLDVRQIVGDHIRTLVDQRTDRTSTWDLVVFFVLPALLSALIVCAGIRLDDTQTTVLITALSVFAALLFNLLLLTHSIVKQPTGERRAPRKRLLREVYANISFAILIAVLAIIVLLAGVLFRGEAIALWSSATVYFLVMTFLLTLFLVLKRIHVMLREEFEEP